MKDNNDVLGWREALKINHQALKFLYKEYPQMILSRFAYAVWKALTPYVEIYLSALIIDELAGNRDVGRLKSLVVITLIVTAVIMLGTALIEKKWRDGAWAGWYFKMEQIYIKKFLDLDYIRIDDVKTHELYSQIRQNQYGGGWGFYHLMDNYETLLASVFSLIGGVALTISLFTSVVPESAVEYTWLNNPLYLFLVIAVMLVMTYISPMLSTKAGKYWTNNVDSRVLSENLFWFFSFLGHNPKKAADVRMYRQERMCNKYSNKKTSAYGSKGYYAKCAKGPMGGLRAAATAVSVVFVGIVYVFVCLKAWAGAYSVGAVTRYVASITKLSGGLSDLIAQIGDMRINAAFLKLEFEFLNMPNTMYQGSLTVEKRADKDYEVEFCNVSFRYPGCETYTLKNVSIKFRIGERLAVVGMNGSGKTTFIKLLCRLYDPTEGEILLNGIDIRKYNYLDYMAIFSIVFQDFNLFAFKLGQNLAAKMEYDKERALDSLQKSGFEDRLAQLPDGMETYLYKDFNEDGVDISGGEAQKIAIARSLYKNAPFIILDEPTAALDPIAESEVYSKFNEIVSDKTAIFISHRLSSCRFCDEIAVFDNGRIVQQGTHDELVADTDGKYYELWHAQAQYYA